MYLFPNQVHRPCQFYPQTPPQNTILGVSRRFRQLSVFLRLRSCYQGPGMESLHLAPCSAGSQLLSISLSAPPPPCVCSLSLTCSLSQINKNNLFLKTHFFSFEKEHYSRIIFQGTQSLVSHFFSLISLWEKWSQNFSRFAQCKYNPVQLACFRAGRQNPSFLLIQCFSNILACNQ